MSTANNEGTSPTKAAKGQGNGGGGNLVNNNQRTPGNGSGAAIVSGNTKPPRWVNLHETKDVKTFRGAPKE